MSGRKERHMPVDKSDKLRCFIYVKILFRFIEVTDGVLL